MNASREKLWNKCSGFILDDIIVIPASKKKGVFKVRITYGPEDFKQEIEPYTPSVITSLKLVYSNEVNYSVKYADRSALNDLRNLRGECDEILIVKNGQITDTSYSNVAFYDGSQWWTPEFPLLGGTQRAKLISEGRLKEKNIRPEDLNSFQGVKLINAMMDLDQESLIAIKNIK
jgi:4-amino-4-deoxychorismate lyase